MLSPTKLLAATATVALLSQAAIAGPADQNTELPPQDEYLVDGMPLWGPFTPDFPLSLLIENSGEAQTSLSTLV
ncbi:MULTISPECIES: hypothetical protein [unclassified Ruegeria]|uniref:hypothetical protein n=1 Tax=unclassified Ruegeria TaxID=2625375 RepID=UPI001489E864|nr:MULTISPECIES: hypothetical protein [unclassified Ruegeria]